MSEKVYIYVNGILNNPGSADNWTDRAVTWTHTEAGYYAEKFEYFTDIFFTRFRQGYRARKLARMISFYRGWDIVLVGHSNGCDVILKALDVIDGAVPVSQLHLIAGACEEDIAKNGLRFRLERRDVRHVYLYLGGRDEVMKLNYRIEKYLPFNLGYGTMGHLSPEKAREMYGDESTLYQHKFGHSTWWNDDIFDITMQQIVYAMPSGDKHDPIRAT